MTVPCPDARQSWSLGLWPAADIGLLKPARRQRFETLKSAIDDYLGGKSPAFIEAVYGVKRQEIHYYLKRCNARHLDGRHFGYRALIGNLRIGEYRRSAICNVADGDDGYGCSGAYQKLIRDYPVVQRLIRAAVGGRSGRSPKAAGLHLMNLHGEILTALRKEGVRPTEYPFNVKTAGYGSLCRHIKKLLNEGDVGALRSKYGDRSIDGQIAGTGKMGWLQPQLPMDLVCYDEQALPFIGVLSINVGGTDIEVPLQRCNLCLLVEETSRAAIGYFISKRRRIAAGDILAAVAHSFTPWTQKQLSIPDLSYRKGAGFPSGVVEGFAGRRIGLLKVDNDMTHYANSVVNYMVQRTGCAIQFGKVGRWITRLPVERVFAEMQKRHFRQLPSTTGSGPSDPAVNDPVGKAIRHRIELHELQQLVEVALANYNASPRAELMNKTPLERLEAHYCRNGPGTVIPVLDRKFLSNPQVPTDIFTCTVRGNQSTGRRPYIELDRAHYTNQLLSDSWSLISTRLIVHVGQDFRTLRAFREDGQEFPDLLVSGHWSLSPHDRGTRTEINRLHREGQLKFSEYEDPIVVYQRHLANKALAATKRGRAKVVRETNRLARTLEFTNAPRFNLPAAEGGGPSDNLMPTATSQSLSAGRQWRQIFAASKDEAV